MNAWYVRDNNGELDMEITEGDRIVYVLTVADVESAFDQLAEREGLNSTWNDLTEDERDDCILRSVQAFENFDWAGPLQDAVSDVFEQVKESEEAEEDDEDEDEEDEDA